MSEEQEIKRKQLIASIPEVADIDCYKENIKPRQQGRHATALLIDPIERMKMFKAGNVEFEERLKALDEQDYPLATHLEYIKWTIEMSPSDDTQLMRLLKDATTQFVNELRYKYDPRYLKMWLEYATLLDSPAQIYTYLMSMDIGQSLALFYDEYATFLEGDQRYKEAEDIYEKGIEKQAVPLARLEKNYNMFKIRMEERRERGMVRQQPNHMKQMNALAATGYRVMLGDKADGRSRTHTNFSGFGSIKKSPAISSFEVYTGESTSHIPTPGLPTFHKTENQMIKETFAGATLPKRSAPVPVQTNPKFTVYQDPEDSPSTSLNRPKMSLDEDTMSYKKQRIMNPVLEKLAQRFMRNRKNYLQTKDSKGNTEYICVLNTFKQDTSHEENRLELSIRDEENRLRMDKSEAEKFELSTKEELTAETRGAIESLDKIFYVKELQNEEDLTWTNYIQKFEPVKRETANEND
ncbi:unnamed protein product [Rhizopus stolonifer]